MFEMNPQKLLGHATYVPTDKEREHTRFVSQILTISNAGTILTVLKKREKSGNAWDLPGGGVDPGESFIEAAIREFKEELRINPSSMIPFAYSYEAGVSGLKKNYAALTFLSGMREEISPIVDGIEHVGHAWRKLEHLNTLTPRTKRFDRHLLAHPEIQAMGIRDFQNILRDAMQPSHPHQPPFSADLA